MIKRVREHVGRWIRRDPRELPPEALLFADHEEIQDIARQIRRTKVEMDRAVLAMRSWARDLGRRLAEAPRGLSRGEDLRVLGETVGGLAHNFNNSLAAILAYTELMLRESESEAARRRLEDTAEPVASVAVACGFGSAETMRRAFLKTLEVGPAEYRRRFQALSVKAA